MSDEGTPLSWDEMAKKDLANSKFFKPDTNVEYTIGIKSCEVFERIKNKFEKGAKALDANGKEIMEKRIEADVAIDSENGESVDKIWTVSSIKLRDKLRNFDKEGILKTFLFKVKKVEKGQYKEYEVMPIKPRPAVGQATLGGVSPQPLVEKVAIEIVRMPSNQGEMDVVDDDGSTVTLTRGTNRVSPQLAQTLVDRGMATKIVKIDFSKALNFDRQPGWERR